MLTRSGARCDPPSELIARILLGWSAFVIILGVSTIMFQSVDATAAPRTDDVLLSDPASGPYTLDERVSLDTDRDGRTLATWYQPDEGVVVTQSFGPGGVPLGPAFRIFAGGGGGTTPTTLDDVDTVEIGPFVSVADDVPGLAPAVVTWYQRGGVYAQRFTSDGAAVGGVEVVLGQSIRSYDVDYLSDGSRYRIGSAMGLEGGDQLVLSTVEPGVGTTIDGSFTFQPSLRSVSLTASPTGATFTAVARSGGALGNQAVVVGLDVVLNSTVEATPYDVTDRRLSSSEDAFVGADSALGPDGLLHVITTAGGAVEVWTMQDRSTVPTPSTLAVEGGANPRIASTGGAEVVVAWDLAADVVAGRLIDPRPGEVLDARLIQPANTSSGAQSSPSVTVSRSGTFVVGWNGEHPDDPTASVARWFDFNDAPEPQPDSYDNPAAAETFSVAAPGLLENDADLDGDTLTIVSNTQPETGSVAIGADGSFTYTPDEVAQTYPAQFTYTVSDGITEATSDVVIDASFLVDDFYDTQRDLELIVEAPGVLGNDQNPGESAVVTAEPRSGTVELAVDGGFRYTPSAGFVGTDQFEYSTGTLAPATVTVSVYDVVAPPMARDDQYSTKPDITLTVEAPGVLENDSSPGFESPYAELRDPPSSGTVTLDFDGGFVYEPAAGFEGVDTFTYVIGSYTDQSAPATVTIEVATSNAAPVAEDDEFMTGHNSALTIPAPGVLGNDADPNDDSLTVILEEQPTNGTVELAGDGGFTYTPDTGYSGTDSFTYIADDGRTTSAPARASIIVNEMASGTSDDSFSMSEDEGLAVDAPGVKANDPVRNGDIVMVDGPRFGNVELYPDGSFVFAPGPDFSGFDQFSYRGPLPATDSTTPTQGQVMSDGTAPQPASVVTISVTSMDEPRSRSGISKTSSRRPRTDIVDGPAATPARRQRLGLPPVTFELRPAQSGPANSVDPKPVTTPGAFQAASPEVDAGGGTAAAPRATDRDGIEFARSDRNGFDRRLPWLALLVALGAGLLTAVVALIRTLRGPPDPFTGRSVWFGGRVSSIRRRFVMRRGPDRSKAS